MAINEELKNIKNTILKITNINDVQFDKKTKEVVIKKGNVTEKINLSKQKNGSIVVKDKDNKEYEITLTTDQKEIEVYALDRGISPSPNDTINNGKFTEKEIEFQRKLIEELKKDIKEKLNPNNFTNEERRYVEGALKHLDFLRFENCVFTYTNSNKSAGAYTKTLDIKYSEKTPKDDIKITLFHEYLHHVNYMEKVFVYRYNDEMNKRIFNKVEECFEKRKLNINEIYDAFIAYNMNIIGFDVMEWPDFFRDLKDENKKNMVYDYKKRNIEQFNTEVCIQDQYMPSNYYADEISVYSICMKLNNELFSFSISKLEQYKIDLETYRIRHKKAVKYEKDNNFDNQGYPTKK